MRKKNNFKNSIFKSTECLIELNSFAFDERLKPKRKRELIFETRKNKNLAKLYAD